MHIDKNVLFLVLCIVGAVITFIIFGILFISRL